MIDPRFYEHRESDPLRASIGAVILGLLLAAVIAWIGTGVADNVASCPRWLPATARIGSVCVVSPITDALWVIEYRAVPAIAPSSKVGRRIRAHEARWSRTYRSHFEFAINLVIASMIIGFSVGIVFAVIAINNINHKKRTQRVMVEGTRFWANDDEVFASGLAVNYVAPLKQRLLSKIGIRT